MQVLLCGCVFHSAWAFAPRPVEVNGQDAQLIGAFDDRLKILKLIADHVRDNRQRLQTWKGKCIVEDETLIDGAYGQLFKDQAKDQSFSLPIVQSSIAGVRFEVDCGGNLLFTAMEADQPPRFVEKSTGKELKFSTAPFSQRSVLTDEHFLYLKPNEVLQRFDDIAGAKAHLLTAGHVAYRQAASTGRGQLGSAVVDPRNIYCSEAQQDFWQQLEMWVDWPKRKPDQIHLLDEIISVRREGTLERPTYVITFTRGPNGGKIVSSYTCRYEDGFNPRLYTERWSGGNVQKQRTWEYKQQDSIFVPKFSQVVSFDKDGQSVRSRRTIKLQESTINDNVGSDSFSYGALGLKPGELVFDQIKNQTFVR